MATQITNISPKYKDMTLKSALIRPGPPAVYQLPVKEEKFGNLTRMTVGKKDVNMINRAILLVGETGTGKSTLINALANYAMGVKWEDDIWFQMIAEEESQTESQTSDVMVYDVFGFEGNVLPYSLTIIDTPGFGDTRGLDRDAIVSQQLLDLFRSDDGVHELHAVGLVMKASVNRLSDRLKYIFSQVESLFGKNIEKNIVALITHSDGRTPKNPLKALEAAKIKCARNEKKQPTYFLFDNCQSDAREEDDLEALKKSYDVTERGMNQLAKFMGEVEPQKLGSTLDVLNSRIRLTACVHNLQDRIQLIDLEEEKTKQTEEQLKKCKEDLKNDKNFTVEVDENYKEREDIKGGSWGLGVFYDGATCCTRCEENCHYPGCTIAWYPKNCEVMSNGYCTVCTKKCPVSDHVKKTWKYVTKTRKVKKTLEDVKKEYEVKQEGTSGVLRALKLKTEKLAKEKNDYLEEAYQHIIKLEQIALNVSSVSTYVDMDLLIEKMKEKGDTQKVQKLEELKSKQDKGVTQLAKPFFSRVKSTFQ